MFRKFKSKNLFGKIIFIIFFPIFVLEILLLNFYKYCISPLLPHVCRFKPSCSVYFLQAVKEYGPIKGFYLGVKRVLRCNPFSKGGKDLLKPNIKGKIKWIL